MTSDGMGTGPDRDEDVRRALLDAALDAYEDAGLRGLCAEGRWEAAVSAMRSLDLAKVARMSPERRAEARNDDPVAILIESLARVVDVVGDAPSPPPSGGSVAAAAGALAAALTRMVAGLVRGRPRYAGVAAAMRDTADRAATLAMELSELARRDAAAVDAVTEAYKLPKGSGEASATRGAAVERAMRGATLVPRDIARAAATVAELAADVAERGNVNAVADAAVAAVLAESVCRAAALTVRINLPALPDLIERRGLLDDVEVHTHAAAEAAARAVRAAAPR